MTSPNSLIRRQASLYLRDVPEVEQLRLRFNPAQAALIPAHVTLCREDEVDDWSGLAARIKRYLPLELTIGFGKPERDGNFVWLPVVSGIDGFDELRRHLLSEPASPARKHAPHLTIIHPRNGTCSDLFYAEIVRELAPFDCRIRTISLIQQVDGGPWVELDRFE